MPAPIKATRAFLLEKRVIEDRQQQTEADLNRAITLVEETGAIREAYAPGARLSADAARAAPAGLPASEIGSALSDPRGLLSVGTGVLALLCNLKHGAVGAF